ncbi:MAG: hypothetical protein K1X74_23330 [Pirellulales bacterium]|nr:hypothetical protein [Pirellulales bacterium]
MAAHRIRLRGPWEFEVRGSALGSLPSPGKVHVPCRFAAHLPPGFRGRVRYVRRFGQPPLAAAETLWLVVEGLALPARIELNGRPVAAVDAPPGRGEFMISGLVEPRNVLCVEFAEVDTASEVDWGEVCLEVRQPQNKIGEPET